MLRWRLLLGALLIAAMGFLCWFDALASLPGLYLMPLAVLASLLATQEVLSLASEANLKPTPWTIYFGNVLLVVGSWYMTLRTAPIPFSSKDADSVQKIGQFLSPHGVLVMLGLAVLLVVFREMFRYEKPGGNMANVATGVFALIYVGLMLSFAIQIRFWGISALVAWVVVVKMGDIGAYTVGRLIGCHKMAPRISPGKTMEGLVGALAFSCLGSWLTFQQIAPVFSSCCSPHLPASSISQVSNGHPILQFGWIAFGLLVGFTGLLGDLAESMLKRDVGRKDSSTWLPGFGGVLDILDSLLLSAPVAWMCFYFGLVHV